MDLSSALITQDTLGVYRDPGFKPTDRYQALMADKYTLTVDVAIGEEDKNVINLIISNSEGLSGLNLNREQKEINLRTPWAYVRLELEAKPLETKWAARASRSENRIEKTT